MNWGSAWTIIRREYVTRVRTKSFVIMTFLLPALMGGSILLPLLFERYNRPTQRRIALADGTGLLADSLRAALDDTLPDGRRRYVLDVVAADSNGIAEARRLVNMDVYNALVVVPEDVVFAGRASYQVSGTPNFGEMRRISNTISQQVIALRLHREGLDPAHVGALMRQVRVEPMSLRVGDMPHGAEVLFAGTAIMAMLMYLSLMLYGAWTLRAVLGDKTSRVVEILVSTASPTELMFAKIIGIGSVGLTQMCIWIGALLLAGLAAPISKIAVAMSALSEVSLPAFLLFYVTGFVLYATLYAGVGALCSSEEDAQQLQLPVALLLMVPIFLIGPAINSPDSPLIVVLSYVPYFSPVLMLLRLGAGNAGWLQVSVALFLMVGTIALSVWLVGRLFRVGILMMGKRPGAREIWRWLRQA